MEVERCWCDKWPRRCTNRVTQEDMRCDLCRRGRCELVVAGNWHAHCETFTAEVSGTYTFSIRA
jgi:hypothetical protein